jgi:Transposase DDE domain
MEAIVQTILAKMGKVRKPELTALTALFTAILTVCGKVNFMNLSRYSERNEKTFRRQFKQGLPAGKFNAAFVEIEIPEAHEVIGVLDASFNPKSGKQTFGLDRFYNGSHGRVERGLELSLLAVVDTVTENAYAIHAQQTYSQSQYPLITRTEQYLMQVQENRRNLPERVQYLAVDNAYANAPFIEGVLPEKLDIISKLRQNANLHYVFEGPQQRKGAPRKYDGKVNLSDLSRFTRLKDVESGLELYTLVVWHRTWKRKIRLALLVNRREGKPPQYILLFSTDLNLSGEKILKFYKLRFQIEFLFRDAKQFTGLSDCQSRNELSLNFHFNTSFMALNLAKREARLQQSDPESFVFSMNNVKRRALNDHLLETFIDQLDLSPTLIKSHPNYQNLRNYGVIVA